jgi:hypothetical protein
MHAEDATRLVLDLTHEQLVALARATAAACRERHRHQEMDVDDVLAMRELTALGDGLSHLARNGACNVVSLTARETGTLRAALSGWLDELERRGWMRDDDRECVRIARAVLDPHGAVAYA